MAVIGINYSGADHTYDENDELVETPGQMKYESVYIYYGDGKEKVFDSGNFVKDWFDAKGFFARGLMDEESHLSCSSSCDNFHFDGAKFDSGYLHIVDGNPFLKYVDESDPNYLHTQRDIFTGGWEFFVPEGTKPTWEELKELCK
jgi:hypothetical protein